VSDLDLLQALRMAAVRERLGQIVRSDELVRLAVEAVVGGLDGVALVELAGLTHREEPEAHDVFARVVDELALAPDLPADARAARWELVRWWCSLIVDGHVAAEVGGRLIWNEGWVQLDYPEVLRPIVGWVSEWEDWTDAWGEPRETYCRRIVEAARDVLRSRTS
jgi:hypothetical protein